MQSLERAVLFGCSQSAFSYMSRSSAGSLLILTGTAEKKHKGESQDQAKDHCRYKYITSLLFHLNVNQFKVPEY